MKRFAFKVSIGAGPRRPSLEAFLILAGGIPPLPCDLSRAAAGQTAV